MTGQQPERYKVRCPECLAAIYLKDTVQRWDPVTCHECHTALEVVSRDPLELDYLLNDYEDEDEDRVDDL